MALVAHLRPDQDLEAEVRVFDNLFNGGCKAELHVPRSARVGDAQGPVDGGKAGDAVTGLNVKKIK